MVDKINLPVYCHQIRNLPAPQKTSNIFLKITNSGGELTLSEKQSGYLTQYIMEIYNPSIFHFSSEKIKMEEIMDLILSINLNMMDTCMTVRESHPPTFDVFFEPIEPTVEIDKNGKRTTTITKIARIGSSYSMGISYQEELDLLATIQSLNNIKKINRHNLSAASPVKTVNLAKSLSAYEGAMNSTEELSAFTQLAISLEQATDWEGLGLQGSNLDNEVTRITSESISDVEGWRKFYNRSKHIDRNLSQVERYFKGLENLSRNRYKIREVCNMVINDRLIQI